MKFYLVSQPMKASLGDNLLKQEEDAIKIVTAFYGKEANGVRELKKSITIGRHFDSFDATLRHIGETKTKIELEQNLYFIIAVKDDNAIANIYCATRYIYDELLFAKFCSVFSDEIEKYRDDCQKRSYQTNDQRNQSIRKIEILISQLAERKDVVDNFLIAMGALLIENEFVSEQHSTPKETGNFVTTFVVNAVRHIVGSGLSKAYENTIRNFQGHLLKLGYDISQEEDAENLKGIYNTFISTAESNNNHKSTYAQVL